MDIPSARPERVRTLETVFIPLADGTRIAATIWLPERADHEPLPAVLEMVPYRRRDGTACRDAQSHPWVAGQGFACVRVDLRGSGDSDGILLDEYLPREQEDAIEIIDWIANQSWCTGAVGMTGISWGGFIALQVAARRPEPLKAIIPYGCSDDRYADDIHYMGGSLITENPMWSAMMYTLNAMPPDPQVVGDRWRRMWRDRLEANRPWIDIWLEHQQRDAYWRQGSVCEDYSSIECAVYAVGGWDDSYSNAIPRLMAGLHCPKKALIGPWTHVYPHDGAPGPNIHYLQESVRWWNYWLKGEDTGIMDEPAYRVWMLEPHEPAPYYDTHPGRWVAEPEWPSSRSRIRRFALDDEGRLIEGGEGRGVRTVHTPQTAGLHSGRWGGYGGTSPDMAIDQRGEDGLAVSFTSLPLDDDLEILGAPELSIAFTVDRPRAQIAARLCDVAPDGTSTLVTYGVLNLCHGENHQDVRYLEPGEPYKATVALNDIAYRFPQGNSIRVALSSTYWPTVFPQPDDTSIHVDLAASGFELPERRPRPEDEQLRDLGDPEHATGIPCTILSEGYSRRTVTEDVGTGRVTLTLESDEGTARLDDRDITRGERLVECFSIQRDDPLSAHAEAEAWQWYESGEARVEIRTLTTLSATADTFDLACRLWAWDDGVLLVDRRHRKTIPRNGV